VLKDILYHLSSREATSYEKRRLGAVAEMRESRILVTCVDDLLPLIPKRNEKGSNFMANDVHERQDEGQERGRHQVRTTDFIRVTSPNGTQHEDMQIVPHNARERIDPEAKDTLIKDTKNREDSQVTYGMLREVQSQLVTYYTPHEPRYVARNEWTFERISTTPQEQEHGRHDGSRTDFIRATSPNGTSDKYLKVDDGKRLGRGEKDAFAATIRDKMSSLDMEKMLTEVRTAIIVKKKSHYVAKNGWTFDRISTTSQDTQAVQSESRQPGQGYDPVRDF
jgi:hypothetical protein